ncbi:alpha-N-acetyl-neuraminyl-2,3-beta-galactosyl-1,3-N-acetyl-galactosaminide alpha-2,6-sialyltransferase isoform X2 [Rhinatrema bivittatum]|uniref:alpha-N-acetyl-neuraminyl-2,3-beta-galactosyl-1, 3-N-acetyl-galactosaminide alpha-2,6-sialyltransferase isoform X2 n=1 Tax=Rhinatrema bivittatum TaxID=194408 RepID=UPI00112E8148|nr:alpha-N-acetyl-neuraminyl-2,3-beta-galactosyl-1,3-N-acetyl-galactosaminide alpha-2,6-sialyltransferase isoform X2 [Rhinatrema bivittatum]
MILLRAFAGVVTLSASALLYVLLCEHFCFRLCLIRCVNLQRHKGSSIRPESGTHALWGYSRVPDGEPLLRAPCQQCAVVSSSGQMLGSRQGKEIDEAPCVLRMNQAPTEGYEEDVGRRITIRVVSHTSVPLLIRDEAYFFRRSWDTLYVIWGPQKLMSRDKGGSIYRILKSVNEIYPNVQIYTLTDDMMAHCDNIFQNETGKNREKNVVSVPYHYFEKGKLDECKMYLWHEQAPRGAHRFITEKMVFSRWAKRKDIVFRYPSWKDT